MADIQITCKYVPEELLAGFDRTVCRLDPMPSSFSCAESCAHPNLCGYGKAVLEEVTQNRPEGLILTDCCDTMRRVYDVLESLQAADFLYFLSLPHKTGPAQARFFQKDLEELICRLEVHTQTPWDWHKAWQAWQKNAQIPEQPGAVLLRGAHGGTFLKEEARRILQTEIQDATCTGNRTLRLPETDPETEQEFLEVYARALLDQPFPCMRMLEKAPAPVPSRPVLYHTVKFCDYYSFEYARLAERPDMKLLKIETDCSRQSKGQLSTRLEAFREMLGGKKAESSPCTGSVYAGIDSGSTSTEAVLVDADGQILACAMTATGSHASASSAQVLKTVLEQAGLCEQDLAGMIRTGYGRDSMEIRGESVTEITCHARGAHHLFPEARTVIDIGGQDSKVIVLDEHGKVQSFVMNDKCAAGTGRFLELMARTLSLSLQELSELGLSWKHDVVISSMCTVFAESEVVSLIADNTLPADIIHGLNQAVASKTVSLARRTHAQGPYVMTGGVASNQGVVLALEEKLKEPVHISEQSRYCGALGAALIAAGL